MSLFYNFDVLHDAIFASKNLVKKIIPFMLSALLIICFFFLITEKAFSQANQDGNKTDTTGHVTTTSDGHYTYEKGITPGRARSLVGVATGLISLIIGWRAKVRSNNGSISGNRRTPAMVALILGLFAIVLGVVHLSTSAGAAFGSGSGKAGAIAALVFGITGAILSGLALKKHIS
jgi:hypothetical protein